MALTRRSAAVFSSLLALALPIALSVCMEVDTTIAKLLILCFGTGLAVGALTLYGWGRGNAFSKP